MKMPIRSRVPASSWSPAVLNRISARYSPRREGSRASVGCETSTAASAAPISSTWKKTAKWSKTRMPLKASLATKPSESSAVV